MSGRWAGVIGGGTIQFFTDGPLNRTDTAYVDTQGMSPMPEIGWVLGAGGTFSAPEVTPAPVPNSVTPAQARIALSRAGLLDTVNAAIAGLTGQSGLETQIWWATALQIERQNAHLLAMATALGLSSDQVDDLFRTAATIV